MREQDFWSIIESAKSAAGKDPEARVDALEDELSALSTAEIQEFQHQYDQMIHRSNRWDLWGAAYLMNGGCSDDGFRYFCHWLISEGQQTFEKALSNPDSLAQFPNQDYFELESFAYVALKQFEAKGGGELERDFSIEMAAPIGKEWTDDELPSLLPLLAQKYGG
ncbi:DUF4240 domain-containing protein [Leptothrix ochracea]|uniref:DUF4240 domain-containing protein n=1 Tax=Leptothrix ochracea TaxID=735331 RepID=UPI0034E248EA